MSHVDVAAVLYISDLGIPNLNWYTNLRHLTIFDTLDAGLIFLLVLRFVYASRWNKNCRKIPMKERRWEISESLSA